MMIAERQIQIRHHLESLSFAECVYAMLDDAATQGFEDIIRWEADGRSFKVYNVKDFEKYVQPVYLNQSKLRSFQRKLVAHGFTCIPGGPSRGAYRHDMFVRGGKESCRYIQQLKSSGSPIAMNIGNANSSSFALEDGIQQLVGGETSLLVGDSPPPLSAHFWKAVLDSQPTGSPSTTRASFSAKVDNQYEERPPSSTFKSLVPLVEAAMKKPGAVDYSSAAAVDATPMMSLLTTLSDQTSTASRHHDQDDQFVSQPLAGPPPTTMMGAPTMVMRSCSQQTQIATSCFLLDDPEEPLLLPSTAVANPINHTSIPAAHGNNLNKRKSITDSMSFSLFSMELDDILLDDLQTNKPHNHQISSRDTLSLQESILCGSWRERLLTTDEDDNEDSSLQYIFYGSGGGAGNSSASSGQSSISSESRMSR